MSLRQVLASGAPLRRIWRSAALATAAALVVSLFEPVSVQARTTQPLPAPVVDKATEATDFSSARRSRKSIKRYKAYRGRYARDRSGRMFMGMVLGTFSTIAALEARRARERAYYDSYYEGGYYYDDVPYYDYAQPPVYYGSPVPLVRPAPVYRYRHGYPGRRIHLPQRHFGRPGIVHGPRLGMPRAPAFRAVAPLRGGSRSIGGVRRLGGGG